MGREAGGGLPETIANAVVAAFAGMYGYGNGAMAGGGYGSGSGAPGGGKGTGKGKGKGKGSGRQFLEGDWLCRAAGMDGRTCSFHNFASRTFCFKCNTHWMAAAGGKGQGGGIEEGKASGGSNGKGERRKESMQGGGGNGAGKGPIGAAGSRPLLSWNNLFKESREKNEDKAKQSSREGSRPGQRAPAARNSEGFTTMLRAGKPRGGHLDEHDKGKIGSVVSVSAASSEAEEPSEDEGSDTYMERQGHDGRGWSGNEEEDEGDEGSGYEEDDGGNEEATSADVDELRSKWETAKEELATAKWAFPKGSSMVSAASENVQKALKEWKEARGPPLVQVRLSNQLRKCEKNKAKLQKWKQKLWDFQKELEPKWRELQRRVADAEDKVRQDEGVLEELMQASREEQGEEDEAASGKMAICKARTMVGNWGQQMAQVMEEVQDEGTKNRLNLLIVEASKIEGALQMQGGAHGNAERDDTSADEGEGREAHHEQTKPERKTKKRKKGPIRKKKEGTAEEAPTPIAVEEPAAGSTKGESAMGDETRRLSIALEGVAQHVDARAQEIRKKAEETLEEPMRTRIAELEMQARISCRDLFRDMAMENMKGDKITSAWVAAYSKKHGFS